MTGEGGESGAGGPTRVLLADDAADLREVLRRLLERDGRFEVVGEVGTGDRVVPMVEEVEPDVVLLDLSMPVMSGREAIPLIREASADVRVVVMSGAGSFDVLDARYLGADAYLEKGTSIDRVIATLSAVVGRDPGG